MAQFLPCHTTPAILQWMPVAFRACTACTEDTQPHAALGHDLAVWKPRGNGRQARPAGDLPERHAMHVSEQSAGGGRLLNRHLSDSLPMTLQAKAAGRRRAVRGRPVVTPEFLQTPWSSAASGTDGSETPPSYSCRGCRLRNRQSGFPSIRWRWTVTRTTRRGSRCAQGLTRSLSLCRGGTSRA